MDKGDSADAHTGNSSSDTGESRFPSLDVYEVDPVSSVLTDVSSQPASQDTREASYGQDKGKREYRDGYVRERASGVKSGGGIFPNREAQTKETKPREFGPRGWAAPSHYYSSQGKLMSTWAMQRRWYCMGGVLFSIAMVLLMGAIRVIYPRVPVVSLHNSRGSVIRVDLSTRPETFIVELSSLFSIDNRQWFLPIVLTNMEFSAINMEHSMDPILILNDPTSVEVPARSRKAFLSQARISTRDLSAVRNLPAALDCAEKHIEAMHLSPRGERRGCTLHVRTRFESRYLGFKLSNHELDYDIVL